MSRVVDDDRDGNPDALDAESMMTSCLKPPWLARIGEVSSKLESRQGIADAASRSGRIAVALDPFWEDSATPTALDASRVTVTNKQMMKFWCAP